MFDRNGERQAAGRLMCISLDSGRMDDNDVLFGPETK